MQDSYDVGTAPPIVPSEKNATLIEEVKKFPALYDARNPNYYVLARRNEAWLEVARNCREPADQCHLRWKSLRKRFAKEKRRFPEILQGHRRPWALFPKMAFLTPTPAKNIPHSEILKARLQSKSVKKTEDFKEFPSDDDMLILNENDEIVRTCKPGELEEEDEYIYETLDDPDSLIEMMKAKPFPKVKPKAIRSGGPFRPPPVPSRIGGSGRIRKVTPKMQNSIIAKKLKQAQTYLNSSISPITTINPTKTTKRVFILNKTPVNKPVCAEQPSQHININSTQVEKKEEDTSIVKKETYNNQNPPVEPTEFVKVSTPSSDEKKTFKVVKLKGRNPMIFSPDQLPEIQELLKSESAATPVRDPQKPAQTPTLKIRSVDNLNNEGSVRQENNLDIIHSVGLVRKGTVEKVARPAKFSHQSYTRAYSWNRPGAKQARKAKQAAQGLQPQPDSQTNDYEIEESWNDIKQEKMDEDYWTQPQEGEDSFLPHEPIVMLNTPETTSNRTNNLLTKVNEAKLDLINYQRKLLEEQHRKTLEYMKKEHDLKMTVLRAEIDLKRKQLNILL